MEARHPLLRLHLVTGETSLFLSTLELCSALDGVDADRSRRSVAILYRRSTGPDGLYRHAWRSRESVISDNRTTLHRGEHSDVVGDRMLHRGLVLSEEPIAAQSSL